MGRLISEETSLKLSLAGRRGYEAAQARLGGEFHKRGGEAYSKLYFYTNPQTGAVGIEAAAEAGLIKGKRHRYRRVK